MSGLAEHMTLRSLDVVETAKLIRARLRDEFPGVKFSVRSDRYAGGSSIRIRWTDGPPVSAVDPVTGPFAGKSFDGMIDLAYYTQAWLLPDGSAQLASSPGTTGSAGTHRPVMTDPPHPDAELVRFGADYVQCHRDRSPEFDVWLGDRVVACYADRCPVHETGDEACPETDLCPVYEPNRWYERGGAWGSTLAHRIAEETDAREIRAALCAPGIVRRVAE